ncbi:MAG: N-acetylmuramoyl-L-alanine amidase [Sphingobacteriaceae bacterium]|nr:N-acetylmuramoyl-L-alanine amidase [Sphingobacteriaceae bacterium]
MRILIIFALWLSASCVQGQDIQPLPLPSHCSAPRTGTVTHVMLHYISNALQKPESPYELAPIIDIFVKYKLSAHYLIARDGSIYQLVPHNRVAFHAGKGRLPHPPHHENALNGRSIGIEMMAIGTAAEMALLGVKNYDAISDSDKGFTDAQYVALIWLLDKLEQELPSFQKSKLTVVGHDAYAPTRRGDPGQLFDWEKLQLPAG